MQDLKNNPAKYLGWVLGVVMTLVAAQAQIANVASQGVAPSHNVTVASAGQTGSSMTEEARA